MTSANRTTPASERERQTRSQRGPGADAVRRGLARAALGALATSLVAKAIGWDVASGAAMLLFATTAPGLLLLAGLDRDGRTLPLRTLVGALALSPLPWVVATALPVFGFGMDLGAASWGAVALFGAGLLLLVRTPVAGTAPAQPSGSGWSGDRWGALPIALMAMLAIAVFIPHGNRLSYHGILHAGVVAQIAAGLLPPENPALAGAPLEFYWLYHWLLAVLGRIDGFSVLVNAPLIDALSLSIYVGVAYSLARRIFPPARAALAAAALGFVGNALFPVTFAAKLASAGAPAAPYWPFDWLNLGWLGGDLRLVSLLGKFLAVGGFPLGLALWALLLDELTPSESGPIRHGVVFFGLLSAIAFHPPTALAAYLALSAAYASLAFEPGRRTTPAALWRHGRGMGGLFAAALLVAAPYLLSIAGGEQGRSIAVATAWGPIAHNLEGIALGAPPLLLALVWAAARGLRDPRSRFLGVATAVLLLAGGLLQLPDNNQYKFVLIAFLPGGALAFEALRGRRAGPLFAVMVALVVTSHGLALMAHLTSASATRTQPTGDGGYLRFAAGTEPGDALLWLRQNTPRTAVVMSREVRFGGSPLAAVSGRGAFLLDGGHHTLGAPQVASRRSALRAVFSVNAPLAPALRRTRKLLDRPLYVLLLESEYPKSYRRLRRRFDAAREQLEPVWRSSSAVLYALRTSLEPPAPASASSGNADG